MKKKILEFIQDLLLPMSVVSLIIGLLIWFCHGLYTLLDKLIDKI